MGHLLYVMSSFVHYFKAISEFKLELQSGKRPIRVKIGNFCTVPCDLEICRRPCKTTGHLFYGSSSVVHHFTAIAESKLELAQKRQIWVKPAFFRVTLKFDGWPWKTIRHIFCATSSFVRHFVAIRQLKMELQSGISGQNRGFCVPCGLDIRQMTLKNSKAHLIC